MNSASEVFVIASWMLNAFAPLSRPRDGSALAADDAVTRTRPISAQVQMAANVALDPLEAFRDLVGQGELRPFAHPTLIRQACESAGLGTWLLQPNDRNERVLRSLNLEYTHEQDAHRTAQTMMKRDVNGAQTKLDEKLQRLEEIKNGLGEGFHETKLKGIPPWTTILTDVSPPINRAAQGHGPDSPVVVWKAASAFLHGSFTTARKLSNEKHLTDFDESEVASGELTPSWQLLSGWFGTCVVMLRRLYIRYNHLATHDYCGNSVPDSTGS